MRVRNRMWWPGPVRGQGGNPRVAWPRRTGEVVLGSCGFFARWVAIKAGGFPCLLQRLVSSDGGVGSPGRRRSGLVSSVMVRDVCRRGVFGFGGRRVRFAGGADAE